MSVIVQELVPADTSGTMFTANPVSGNPLEMVIEASWGVGKSVVSGRVTPDTYYIDTHNGKPAITKIAIGKKQRMLLPRSLPNEGLRRGFSELSSPADKSLMPRRSLNWPTGELRLHRRKDFH